MSSYEDFKKAFISLGGEISDLASKLPDVVKNFSNNASEVAVEQAHNALKIAKEALSDATKYLHSKDEKFVISETFHNLLNKTSSSAKNIAEAAKDVIHNAAEYVANKTK